MSANINNHNAASFLSVADRKHLQSLMSDPQPSKSQDRAETASVTSVSSTSALLGKSSKPKPVPENDNLDAKKLQAQGFMSQIRFSM
jgi:hypothetical protein